MIFGQENTMIGKWRYPLVQWPIQGTERRHLFKTLLESAWTFVNWLTHSKTSKWHDVEAAVATRENAITFCTSSVIRYMRGVPQTCPVCASHRLCPSAASAPNIPEVEWERPTCDKCDWERRNRYQSSMCR